jgi:hypothetical protein
MHLESDVRAHRQPLATVALWLLVVPALPVTVELKNDTRRLPTQPKVLALRLVHGHWQ